jgi:hypothetical protein
MQLASDEVQRMLPYQETIPIPIHLLSPLERRHSVKAKVKAFTTEHVGKAMARS